jgi:hypothetical protein
MGRQASRKPHSNRQYRSLVSDDHIYQILRKGLNKKATAEIISREREGQEGQRAIERAITRRIGELGMLADHIMFTGNLSAKNSLIKQISVLLAAAPLCSLLCFSKQNGLAKVDHSSSAGIQANQACRCL